MGLAVPILRGENRGPERSPAERGQHLGLMPAARLQAHVLKHLLVSGKQARARELGRGPGQGLSASSLLILGAIFVRVILCGRRLNSLTGLYPLDASSTCPLSCDHHQCLQTLSMIPRGRGGKSTLRTPGLGLGCVE